ncbi:MAG: hypothetical protein K8S54_17875 [Spirochaetia bacterium]|nr:hypothetical protein [Spirochaetia bacterium]
MKNLNGSACAVSHAVSSKIPFRSLLLILVCAGLIQCSQIFWRDASLGAVKIPATNGEVEVTVTYQEKNSWDPTMGTTLKRGYQTRLKRSGNNPAETQFKGWILTDTMKCTDACEFEGGASDQYGVSPLSYTWTGGEPKEK